MDNRIERSQWGARPPSQNLLGINTESGTAHWEGPGFGQFGHESCPSKVRAIQAYHMDNNGWSDIAYNFVVCPHGYVFVGRDHGIRSAANGTNASNAVSEAVCYLGGEGDIFTEPGKQSMADTLVEIGGDHHCHRDWFNTACPGDEICGWVKSGLGIPNWGPPSIPIANADHGFPLPTTDWYGTPDKNPHNHSGYYNALDRVGVAQIQLILRDKAGHSDLSVDGFFGPSTKQAVVDVQGYMNVRVDGLVGPETWGTLMFVNAWNS